MILVYHSIKPLGQNPSLAGEPLPGARNLPRMGERGLYQARMRWMIPAGRCAPVSLVQRWLGMVGILGAVRRQTEGRRIILVAQHSTLLPCVAAGKPVVSSAVPAVKPFADVVRGTTKREEFLHATERALEETADPGRRTACQEVARRFA